MRHGPLPRQPKPATPEAYDTYLRLDAEERENDSCPFDADNDLADDDDRD